MKKINNILWLLVLSVAFLTACKKDLSKLDNNPIAGVSLDKEGATTLSVTQFDKLVLQPKLNLNGADESNFSFQWKVTLAHNDTTSRVLSTTKNLNAEISMIPSGANQFYTLVFTATAKDNGLKYITSWPLTVLSSIGEGLVVATTSDGINTDLSHIMSPLVTTDYSSDRIKLNIYSGANNNKTIPGLVKQMRFTTVFRPVPRSVVNTLFAITQNSLTKINTVDFSFAGENSSLFYSPKSTYSFQAISGKKQADIFVENGSLTIANLGIADKIGIPLDFQANVPSIFAFNRIDNNQGITFNFYDEAKGRFIYIPSISTFTFQDRTVHDHLNQPAAIFNPGNLPNKTNLAAGLGASEDLVHVLKDKITGKVNLYVFDKGSSAISPAVAPAPKSDFDLSSAPGIAQAANFVVLDNQRVMYYTSNNKIYAVLYGGATPIIEERYTIAAAESITTLQIYQQTDYPWASVFLPSNNNQLVMSTYSGTGGSGKVYLLPMINLGVGNINQAEIKTYTGFDKITAIAANK